MKWLSLEGKILLAVHFIDCGMSSYLIPLGLGEELNPIMKFFLERSLLSFVVVKIVLALVLVSFLEFLRYKRPEDIKTIKVLQWIVILAVPIPILMINLFYGR